MKPKMALVGKPLEGFDDLVAGLGFVIPLDLVVAHHCGAGDLAGHVIGVGSSVNRNGSPCLGPGDGIGGVGVDDSANTGKSAVEHGVGGRVRGGAQVPGHHPVVEKGGNIHGLLLRRKRTPLKLAEEEPMEYLTGPVYFM